jgi:hypothetical protein
MSQTPCERLFSEPQNAINGPLLYSPNAFGFELLPTPLLAQCADDYEDGERPAADPIGCRGLPATRGGIDRLLISLCERLIALGGGMIKGKQLATELRLPCTRSLRQLVAYGHVHHRLREIVGMPGEGYVWGPMRPGIYEVIAGNARKMGRCFFFNSTLYKKGRTAIEAAQLLLDFVGDAQPSQDRHGDELAAMVRAEGVTVEDVLSAVFEAITKSEAGKATLARLGNKHRRYLLSEADLADTEAQLASAQAQIQAARTAFQKLRPAS